MPFKFDSPEGRMEVTVRRGPTPETGGDLPPYIAGLTFLAAGPRALKRVQLSARAETYGGAMHLLTEGFKVTPTSHDKDSAEFRVLTALCHAQGVVDLDS